MLLDLPHALTLDLSIITSSYSASLMAYNLTCMLTNRHHYIMIIGCTYINAYKA